MDTDPQKSYSSLQSASSLSESWCLVGNQGKLNNWPCFHGYIKLRNIYYFDFEQDFPRANERGKTVQLLSAGLGGGTHTPFNSMVAMIDVFGDKVVVEGLWPAHFPAFTLCGI